MLALGLSGRVSNFDALDPSHVAAAPPHYKAGKSNLTSTTQPWINPGLAALAHSARRSDRSQQHTTTSSWQVEHTCSQHDITSSMNARSSRMARCPEGAGAARAVSFASQVWAVLCKDAALQRRAWISGLFKLVLPLVLLGMLLAVQLLVDQELSGREYRCGCQCLSCCHQSVAASGDQQYECFNATSNRPCTATMDCQVYNDSNCGALYSSYKQVAFCPVDTPATWPALLQVPLSRYRAQPSTVSDAGSAMTAADTGPHLNFTQAGAPAQLLFVGQDPEVAAQLTRHMFANDTGVAARLLQAVLSSPRLQAANLGAGITSRIDLCTLPPGGGDTPSTSSTGGSTGGGGGGGALDTTREALAMLFNGNNSSSNNNATAMVASNPTETDIAHLSMQMAQLLINTTILLGTAADTSASLQIEPAFVAGAPEYGASGSSSSNSGGGGGGSFGPPGGSLLGNWEINAQQVLPLYLLSDNCTALMARGGADVAALRQLSCGLRAALGIPLVCATLQPTWGHDVSTVNRQVYCSWRGANCQTDEILTGGVPYDVSHSVVHQLAQPAMQQAAAAMQLAHASTGNTSSTTAPAQQGRRRLKQSSVHSRSMLQAPTTTPLQLSVQPTPADVTGMATSTASNMSTSAAAFNRIQSTALAHTENEGYHRAVSVHQYPSALVDWGQTCLATAAKPAALPVMDVTLWLNNSNLQASVAPAIQRWALPVNLAANAYLTTSSMAAQQANGVSWQSWELRIEGVRGFPSEGGPLKLDLASLLGPLFIMWVLQLPLPMMVAAFSVERLRGHRALMMRQGLSLAAHATATYLWWLLFYALFVTVFVIFGWAAGLSFFTQTAPGVQIVLYFVWFHAQFALACWIATFYDETQSAVMAAVALLIFTGLVANLVIVQFVESGPEWLALLLEALAPPFALFRALWEACQYAFLAESTGQQGLTWAAVHEEANGFGIALGFLTAHTIIGLWCAYYWDEVFAEGTLRGPHKHPLFPLGFKHKPDDPRGWDWFTAHAVSTAARVISLMSRAVSSIKRCCSSMTAAACCRYGHGFQQQQATEDTAITHARVLQPEVKALIAAAPVMVVSHSSAGCEGLRNGNTLVPNANDGRAIVQQAGDSAMAGAAGMHSNVGRSAVEDAAAGVCLVTHNVLLGSSNDVGTEPAAVLYAGVHTPPMQQQQQQQRRQQQQQQLLLSRVSEASQEGYWSESVTSQGKASDAWGRHENGSGCGNGMRASDGGSSGQKRASEGGSSCKSASAAAAMANNQPLTKRHDVAPERKRVEAVLKLLECGTMSMQGASEQQVPAILLAGIWRVFKLPQAPTSRTKDEQHNKFTAALKQETTMADAAVSTASNNKEAAAFAGSYDNVSLSDLENSPRALHSTSRSQLVTAEGRSYLKPLVKLRQHVAVKDLWLQVEQGECFGLLGPNGAGKTTTLRMMQGLLEPSKGQVLLCGHDVASNPNVTSHYAGICPQHDVLWPSLSAEEHLACYGRLRGLKGSELKEAMTHQLQLLGLSDEPVSTVITGSVRNRAAAALATRPCSSFSGGMRRRLSVACALLGSPQVVFLDEPSAGLDPASRAALWKAVQANRKAAPNTAIVLTTHSMREAETLCNRLGIFVAGQLQCVGSAQALTQRYASSLLLSMTCPAADSAALQQAVREHVCDTAHLVCSDAGSHQWEIPRAAVNLPHLFTAVQQLVAADTPADAAAAAAAAARANGTAGNTAAAHGKAWAGTCGVRVLDWGVMNASLDHVFHAIVTQHEIAAATDVEAEG